MHEEAARIELVHSACINYEHAGDLSHLLALCADDIEFWPPKRIEDGFTEDQHRLYGKTFGAFASKLNTLQGSEINADAAQLSVSWRSPKRTPHRSG
jgi:hypothetical protein